MRGGTIEVIVGAHPELEPAFVIGRDVDLSLYYVTLCIRPGDDPFGIPPASLVLTRTLVGVATYTAFPALTLLILKTPMRLSDPQISCHRWSGGVLQNIYSLSHPPIDVARNSDSGVTENSAEGFRT